MSGPGVTVTAVTGTDHMGHWASCEACGWWQRGDAQQAVMAAWRHRCPNE